MQNESPAGMTFAPARIEIDGHAIVQNLSVIRSMVGPETQIYATIKANGYGLGTLRAANLALGGGADGLALVDLEDALMLRQRGISAPILLFGGHVLSREALTEITLKSLILSVTSDEVARLCCAFADPRSRVFVELNCGGERLGLSPNDAVSTVERLELEAGVSVDGVYTHPSFPADGHASPCVDWQFERFERAVSDVVRAGFNIPVRMAESSKSLLLGRRAGLTAVDPGSLVYGFDPTGSDGLVAARFRSALVALKTSLVHAFAADRTEFLSEAPAGIRQGMRIGILPLGKAHRFPDLHSGEVLVRGVRCRVLGKSSAEHTRIDVSKVSDAQPGDEVVVIGSQGNESISIGAVAQRLQASEASIAQTLPRGFHRWELTTRSQGATSESVRR